MNKYELTVVLPQKSTPAKKKSFEEKVKKLAESLKGKVSKTEDWGEHELGYKMKKNTAGNFLLFQLEMEPFGARQIDSKLKVEDSVLRHLLIKSEVRNSKHETNSKK